MYKLSCKKPHLAILILMVSLVSIGAALYTPGLPQIALYFHVSNGIIIAIIGSLLCALSAPLHSISLLIVARFIAAIGSCAGLVVTLTIVNDYYYQEQARRILPYVAASFAIVPGLAVSIGGGLVQHFGWAACFYFLAIYYPVAFIFVIRLPETAMSLDHSATKWGKVFKSYYAAFANLHLVLYAIMVAAFAGLIYVYTTNAPIITYHNFNFSPSQLGLINLIPFVGYLMGNILNSHVSKILTARQSILLGGIVLLILTILLWTAYTSQHLTPFVFLVLMTLVLFNVPFVWSNATILATATHPDGSNANAMLGFMNVSGAIIGVLFSSIFNHNLLFTTLVTFIIICIIIFALYIMTGIMCKSTNEEKP